MRLCSGRPDIDARGQHFEFLVFGSGRRSCPGANLGTLMVEIMLARLLHSFTFTAPTEPHQDQDTFAAGRDGKWLGTDGTLMALPSISSPAISLLLVSDHELAAPHVCQLGLSNTDCAGPVSLYHCDASEHVHFSMRVHHTS